MRSEILPCEDKLHVSGHNYDKNEYGTKDNTIGQENPSNNIHNLQRSIKQIGLF